MITLALAAVMFSAVVLGVGGPQSRAVRQSTGRVVLVLASVALGVLGPWTVLGLAPVVAFAGRTILAAERKRKERVQRLREVPTVVEVLARRVALGMTVSGAMEGLNERQLAAANLANSMERIHSGESVAAALSDSPSLISSSLLATELSGDTRARALERLADRLRLNAMDGQAAQSQSGQQLASAAVMSLLPPAVSVLYALSDERAANFYLHTPWGAVVVLVSLALSALGWLWMRQIMAPRGSQ